MNLTRPTTVPRGPSARLCAVALMTLAVAGLTACRTTPVPTQPPAAEPPPIPVDALPGFGADDLAGLTMAIDQQCAMARPPGNWATLCGERTGRPLRPWLAQRFTARELIDEERPEGLATGYYEPLLTGSLLREHPRQVPLRARPADLLTIDLSEVEPRLKGMRLRGRLDGQRVVPYYDRAQIESREAGGKVAARPAASDVIAWADNPIDAFFLEIQGSGRLQLRDGRQLRIGYADQNGHPYHPIGRTLVQRGALSQDGVTAPAIRNWLAANPVEAVEVMRTNPSLVYFRTLPPPGDPALGPIGSLGVPLTPLRSIAVDRSRIPLGSLVYVETTDPVSGQPMRRLMVAQDTGGAIRGTRRLDVFWGFGEQAGTAAGLMKAPVRMWLLEPVAPAAPRS